MSHPANTKILEDLAERFDELFGEDPSDMYASAIFRSIRNHMDVILNDAFFNLPEE